MSGIQCTTLNNGLRVITDTVDSVHSVAIGIWVGVGTRDEDLKFNGVAHMVEHMLFKGTDTRSAKDIAEQLENAGGYINAYTSREITSYHAHVLKEDLGLALDILADMAQNSTLPEEEIEREREVITQEIGMCNDTPDDLIFDHFYETAWPDQGLGAPILGKAEIIAGMTKEAIRSHITKFYTPGRIVVSAAGNVKHKDLVKQVEALFTRLPADAAHEKIPARYRGGESRVDKQLEQSHVTLGFRGVGRLDESQHAARALSAIMGGGMSSRLFQEIREKRGLAYSVYSFSSSYADDGSFGIYAGTGPEKLSELIPVVCDEIRAVANSFTDTELARAKAQMKTGMLMGKKSMMTRADQQAKYLLYRNEVIKPDDLIKKIDSIDRKAVQGVAQRIFSGAPTLSALGPLGELEEFSKIRDRLSA